MPINGQKLMGDWDRPCLFKIPDINIHISIDRLIDLSMDRLNGSRETSVVQHTAGHISQPIYQ